MCSVYCSDFLSESPDMAAGGLENGETIQCCVPLQVFCRSKMVAFNILLGGQLPNILLWHCYPQI